MEALRARVLYSAVAARRSAGQLSMRVPRPEYEARLLQGVNPACSGR